MTEQILTTRLMMPRPHSGVVMRERLFSRLDELQQYPLTMIKGKPGSGKTTLLTSYLQDRNLSARWLRLDDECNEVSLFWDYVSLAFADLAGYTAAPEDSDSLLAWLRGLLNLLAGSRESILVFDDFHTIHHSAILESFCYFIGKLPPNIHLVILTRHEPALPFAVYELKGILLRLEEDQLAFTHSEGIQFLLQTIGTKGDSEVFNALITAADGWIGGLQLLAGSKAGTHSTAGSRDASYLHSYIDSEIYAVLSPKLQQFLVMTSPLLYFNKLIAETVIPGLNYDNVLDSLFRQNLMIQCMDGERKFYGYHDIFRDFLLTKFHGLEPVVQEAAYRSAERAYHELGDDGESLRLLFLLGEEALAASRILALPHNSIYYHYIGKLSVKAAAADFDAAFQKLFYHYSRQEYTICMSLYETAIPYCESDFRYEAFRGTSILFHAEGYSADEPLPLDLILSMDVYPLTRALILAKNAAFLFHKDRFPEALACIRESITSEKKGSSVQIEYFNLTLKTQICEEMGFLNEADASLDQAVSLLKQNGLLHELHRVACHVTAAGLYMKQLRLADAAAALAACEEDIYEQGGQLLHSYQYNRIEYLFLTGETGQAARMLRRLADNPPYQDMLITAPLLKYLLRDHEMPVTMQNDFISAYNTGTILTLNSRLVYARILLLRDEGTRAVALLDEILAVSRKQGAYLKLVEAALLKLTALLSHSQDKRLITDLMKEALSYACENRILQPFYLEDRTVAAFHQRYGTKLSESLPKPEKAFYREVIALCTANDSGILSARELEILKAVAAGSTNAEITQLLFISLPTVKTHISNIFRKLEAGSRVQAVEKARQMGLL